ncbi:MAG: sirohydrochlorin chelatase [Candidatus Hodarchaeales archaeon]|jgi:sirohydrochlorin cobaltochelatase
MAPNEDDEATCIIVLAMHGSPPTDFPKREIGEFIDLHLKMENAPRMLSEEQIKRHDELEETMRAWPRTQQNDPFFASSQELAKHLAKATGFKTIVGFNEFCNPSLDNALEQAALQQPEKIAVVTPMMTQGGQHSEIDIPAAVKRAQDRHPELSIMYVWPYEISDVAQFLATRINLFLE